jgi:spore coat-associated protein N
LTQPPTTIIDVYNIKPGDTVIRSFELVNGGTLDIKNVVLDTAYGVNVHGNNNTRDLGEHIQVNFLFNVDKLDVPVYSTTLADLYSQSFTLNGVEDFFIWSVIEEVRFYETHTCLPPC